MTRMPEMFSCTRSDTAANASCTRRKRSRVTEPSRKISTSKKGIGIKHASARRRFTPAPIWKMENAPVNRLVQASANPGPNVMRMALTSLMA